MHAATVHGFQTITEFHQPLNSQILLLEGETNFESGVSKCMQKLDKIMINIVRCVSHNWKLTENATNKTL